MPADVEVHLIPPHSLIKCLKAVKLSASLTSSGKRLQTLGAKVLRLLKQ